MKELTEHEIYICDASIKMLARDFNDRKTALFVEYLFCLSFKKDGNSVLNDFEPRWLQFNTLLNIVKRDHFCSKTF